MFERITRREEADLFMAWVAISISFAIIKIAPYGVLGPLPGSFPSTHSFFSVSPF